ncbi:MAG: hydrogen gas-evolving membrane-bound hydrogenase subunit E [Actinomycetota bacterium]
MTPHAPFFVLLGMVCLGAVAPVLSKRLGRDAGYVLGAGFLAAAGVLLGQSGNVIQKGPQTAEIAWFPSLEISLALNLDGLGLLFSLLILVVGAFVMAYSARYFSTDGNPRRTYTLLTFFATSMLGLVLADNAILLFVFWELTSITSFLLIGGKGGGRKAATRAFLVTGIGGLSLLAGLLLLGGIAETYSLQEILSQPETIRSAGIAPVAFSLLLIGAFTKSAQFPFHFWLPGAMVASTPVSTYLHAATMVKAGIYLLARTSPLFAGQAPWTAIIVLTGLVTAVVGAGLALKQHDLKALLAYSTVSQLGLLTALVGVGSYAALAAAGMLIVAHALYKATLFMVVGIIESEAGSRDIRELSGLRKAMPLTATVTGLAGLSMVGLPPFLGFISKEEAFNAFLSSPTETWVDITAVLLAVAATIMTFAYGARILYRTFSGPLHQNLYEPAGLFLAPVAVTAATGLIAGLVVGVFDPFINAVARDALGPGEEFHAALWHGVTPTLLLSALMIATGFGLFLVRQRVDRFLRKLTLPFSGANVFDRCYDAVLTLGRTAGDPFLSTTPARHLGIVLCGVVVATSGAAIAAGSVLRSPALPSAPLDWFIVALLGIACIGLGRASNRLAATALLGLAGFLMAVFYVLLGAPDLALTQLLVETLTVALIVLVFRRLPRVFDRVSYTRQGVAAGVALVVGTFAGLATHILTGRRDLSEAGTYYLSKGPEEAGGKNVVNTILVDFRALDTLGEITVLAVAAIGVSVLVKTGSTRRDANREREDS